MVKKALEKISRRIRLMLSRGVVRLIDDGMPLQMLQLDLMSGETRDHVERFQSYGLSTHPHPGAETLAASLNGDRAHMVAIVVDDRRYRITGLAQGEVVLYDDQGQTILIARDRIEITAHSLVKVSAPQTEITGNVKISGDLHVDGNINSDNDVTAGSISLKNHDHQYTTPLHAAGPGNTSPAQ